VRRFEPGETIALRQTWGGRVWAARPATVVEDVPDQTMLFIPMGISWMAPFHDGQRLKIPQPEFELAPLRYDEEIHVLSFSWPDTWYAVLLFLRADGPPDSWYVNLEEPLRRTGLGFDTLDHELDLVIELDGSWRWKDEDDLAEAIRRGVIPAEEEPRMRADGERAVRRILDREPPFDRDWTAWRPDPAWPIPVLPDGWDRV
jgi:Protein of unknown function (DUF402)